MSNVNRSFLADILEFSNAYDDLKLAQENEDFKRNSTLAGMEKYAQTQAQKEELRRLCNRREMYDDEGKLIPQLPAYEASTVYQELAKDAGISWMCDICLAMNFGSQRVCAECGDIKDEKDERLGDI